MVDLKVECLYCGNRWNHSVWALTKPSDIDVKCEACGETKQLRVKDAADKNNVDYYAGCPPFPEPEKEEEPEEFKIELEDPLEF